MNVEVQVLCRGDLELSRAANDLSVSQSVLQSRRIDGRFG